MLVNGRPATSVIKQIRRGEESPGGLLGAYSVFAPLWLKAIADEMGGDEAAARSVFDMTLSDCIESCDPNMGDGIFDITVAASLAQVVQTAKRMHAKA